MADQHKVDCVSRTSEHSLDDKHIANAVPPSKSNVVSHRERFRANENGAPKGPVLKVPSDRADHLGGDRGCRKIAQNVMQDAAVLDIVDLDFGIDPAT